MLLYDCAGIPLAHMRMTKQVLTSVLEAASLGVGRLDSSLEAADLLGMSVREVVECPLRDVEADTGSVDRDEVEALPVVGEGPARAALSAVPPGDELGAADVRVGQRAEGGEALGEEAVRAVRAGDGREGLPGVVVRLVEGDLEGLGTTRRGREGSGGSEGSSEKGGELKLHGCDERGGCESNEVHKRRRRIDVLLEKTSIAGRYLY